MFPQFVLLRQYDAISYRLGRPNLISHIFPYPHTPHPGYMHMKNQKTGILVIPPPPTHTHRYIDTNGLLSSTYGVTALPIFPIK